MNATNSSKSKQYRVVLVEDDPMVQEVNQQFVERVEGFHIVGIASSGDEGLHMVKELKPDLVILDIFMPVQDGIETITQIRKQELSVDVIVISAASDMRTIERMLQNGAVDYIMKPFKFDRVKQALEHYRSLKETLQSELAATQSEIDRVLYGVQREKASQVYATDAPAVQDLPKGLQAVTLKQIMHFLNFQMNPLSAEEVAEGVGIARVTARRYLDYLEKSGQVRLDLQYGIGRPVNKYVLSTRAGE
ncbi:MULTISPECIES: response regulator [unclassified Paenibacillus]|uniref:response regulator n=1 Tax=unclassified Paenibacillus TaxID=185978 RepID=UPI001AE30A09|nr:MULTISPECIES: response regulator [unclassified Paenibacillus]MBP1156872.1 two-component system response regulator DctR [Paenibacillus sp. PvP091]MBP1172389.1 two-component system response regulator DctR [Paenibacillus sp. PvR098]MBP2438770.1 two-component system response regulator DctR [Paenibacillus sp. PvP052]